MSSQRKPAQGRPGPAPERKAAAGPVVTPQVLGVIYVVILIIGVAVYYNSVIKKSQEQQAALKGQISQHETNRKTYEKKRSMLPVAKELNKTVRAKLEEVQYMFMTDQSSVIPFWENDFFPLLERSRLTPGDDAEIKVEKYTFHINMAMSPFETLPPSALFQDSKNVFPIEYHGEENGKPTDTPIDTRPAAFLEPYDIELAGMNGTYADVKAFIEDVQEQSNRAFYTVHCVSNDKQKNGGVYRRSSDWLIKFTVYFINPEASASGDQPPSPPGSSKC